MSVHHISTCAASSPYRKKCRALIQGLYDLPLHEVERLLPAKGGSLEVAVLTVPHCPVDGRVDVSVTVYYVNKEPLFFEYNRQWYPTGEDSGLPCCYYHCQLGLYNVMLLFAAVCVCSVLFVEQPQPATDDDNMACCFIKADWRSW